MRSFFFTAIAFLFAAQLHAGNGNTYPQNYFRNPLDIPIQLAGNFGELRPNHFHTGVDITTHGQEGLPVHAAADGYISRIKITPWGYGKAIYVTHPNGYTTVYGHLSAYNGNIAAYVEKNQYINESFEIELFPSPGELPVKKGDVIAFSGNTGSSGGPHVHFEIRDTKTEDAINPLLFGLPVKDDVAPVAVSLVVCPAEPGAVVNGQNGTYRIPLKASGGGYVFANPKDSIVAYGRIGFAIEGYDKESVPKGKNGVYAVRLQMENKTICSHHIERIPFDKSRYINSFIDYSEYIHHKRFFQQSFLLPNNQLPFFDTVVNNGYVQFLSDSVFHFRYTLSDVFGNNAVVNFHVRSLKKQPPYKDIVTRNAPFTQVLLWDTTNRIEETDFTFTTPSGAFYRNEIFSSSAVKAGGKNISAVITLGDPGTAIQSDCDLSINVSIPESFRSKALIVRLDAKGKADAVGGKWNGQGMTAAVKEFGTYTVRYDTTGPSVKPQNFDLKGKTQDSFATMKDIRFTISDDLSGIKTYRATVDGKWILMQYEPKKRMIWYTFDDHVGKGDHTMFVEVTDACGNKTVYAKKFTR